MKFGTIQPGRRRAASTKPTPGGVDVISPRAVDNAVDLRQRLEAAEGRLRRFCEDTNYGGDEDACINAADSVRRFLTSSWPKLEAAVAAGDAHRFSALMLAGAHILEAAEGAPNELGEGLIITEEIKKTANEVVKTTVKVAAGGAAVYAAGAFAAAAITKALGVW